jgi:septal ring factor EnvC (AmiA/AmiB activator)
VFLQPGYIGAILPIIAVFVTGWIAYSNSDFKRDAERAKSEAETARGQVAKLKPEADTFKQQVAMLQREEASLKPERDQLAAEVRSLQTKATGLQKQIVAFDDRISTWRTQMVSISDRLKTFGPMSPYSIPGGSSIPGPTAEPERKKLQEVIDSMLSVVNQR